jgi:hypothetical protein
MFKKTYIIVFDVYKVLKSDSLNQVGNNEVIFDVYFYQDIKKIICKMRKDAISRIQKENNIEEVQLRISILNRLV